MEIYNPSAAPFISVVVRLVTPWVSCWALSIFTATVASLWCWCCCLPSSGNPTTLTPMIIAPPCMIALQIFFGWCPSMVLKKVTLLFNPWLLVCFLFYVYFKKGFEKTHPLSILHGFFVQFLCLGWGVYFISDKNSPKTVLTNRRR